MQLSVTADYEHAPGAYTELVKLLKNATHV